MQNEDMEQLHLRQMQEFELARKNFDALHRVEYRTLSGPDFSFRLQYNPARMISTNAKIDPATLQNRPCFLCEQHRPVAQKGIAYSDRYHLLVNPYPICNRHFTVPADEHIPQRIEGHFHDLLNLAFDFPAYTTFYNGPSCGASAPDHFHFQMIPRQVLPLEKDCCNERIQEIIVHKDYYQISTLKNYLRAVILLQGSDLNLLSDLFQALYNLIGQATPFEQEPMMNILTWFDNCQWYIAVFPRKQLRPWQFFAEGAEKTLFSPGCIDMAGLIIAPRKEDFTKYATPLLADLFRQITIEPESREYIIHELQNLSL